MAPPWSGGILCHFLIYSSNNSPPEYRLRYSGTLWAIWVRDVRYDIGYRRFLFEMTELSGLPRPAHDVSWPERGMWLGWKIGLPGRASERSQPLDAAPNDLAVVTKQLGWREQAEIRCHRSNSRISIHLMINE